jgi:hypothetical protein
MYDIEFDPPRFQGGWRPGEEQPLSRAQLAHMRVQSDAVLATKPEPPGSPYYVPPVVPKVPAGPPEVAVNPQAAEKGLPDASNLSLPERPPVKPIECLGGPVDLKEAVFKPGPNWSKRGAAQGFLRWILANGEVAATEIFRRGREAGISAKALRKAQKVCGIRPVQRRRAWWWSMPPPRSSQMTCNKTQQILRGAAERPLDE